MLHWSFFLWEFVVNFRGLYGLLIDATLYIPLSEGISQGMPVLVLEEEAMEAQGSKGFRITYLLPTSFAICRIILGGVDLASTKH